jgi:hypothetical protein
LQVISIQLTTDFVTAENLRKVVYFWQKTNEMLSGRVLQVHIAHEVVDDCEFCVAH